MGINFLRGRDFTSQDTDERPKVIIVNEAFARRHFPNEEVLGRRVSFNGCCRTVARDRGSRTRQQVSRDRRIAHSRGLPASATES